MKLLNLITRQLKSQRNVFYWYFDFIVVTEVFGRLHLIFIHKTVRWMNEITFSRRSLHWSLTWVFPQQINEMTNEMDLWSLVEAQNDTVGQYFCKELFQHGLYWIHNSYVSILEILFCILWLVVSIFHNNLSLVGTLAKCPWNEGGLVLNFLLFFCWWCEFFAVHMCL